MARRCDVAGCGHGLLNTDEIADRLRVSRQLLLQWRTQPKPHRLANKGFRLNGESGPLRWLECDWHAYLEAIDAQRSA
ncbi:hypothetical protein [Nocardia sp. NPDC005366]|uniref:hypothetical protein n=1 Tax=Nocardia sp. NPDC005366 TaxID=3156878 RepID=UPI0033A09935